MKYKSRHNWSTQLIHSFDEIVFSCFAKKIKNVGESFFRFSFLDIYFCPFLKSEIKCWEN